jgi:hypothetical protein
MKGCVSGKTGYLSESVAAEALLDAWVRHRYAPGRGPVNVYLCDACGQYHFTSKGEMHARLAQAMKDGSLHRQQQARNWEDRWRGR